MRASPALESDMQKYITIIAAIGRNRAIGLAGAMPWHLPGELKHFKDTTMGKPIVMGRKTWDSIGRALPGRQNIVFGVGSPEASLVFVGEAPGAWEDKQGEPFVGDAGKLLTKMIAAMGWKREEVYIANILKCRPPQNRNPEPDEIEQCEPFLIKQLEVIQPSVIVALGKFAAQFLLGKPGAAIGGLRGRFHEYRGIKVMPTYHPAYLLRSPDQKRKVWADLQLVMKELERQGIRAPHA